MPGFLAAAGARLVGGFVGKKALQGFAGQGALQMLRHVGAKHVATRAAIFGGGALASTALLGTMANPASANTDTGIQSTGAGNGYSAGDAYAGDPINPRIFGFIPNPAYVLNKPVKAFQRTANMATGGAMFPDAGMPKFAERFGITSARAPDIGRQIANGRFDRTFASGRIGDVIGGNLSPEERAMIAHMDPKDRARYLLQRKIQEKAQMTALCSQLQAMRHQMAMQCIQNIR